jgi:8-oxo-dGTP pyrophosphatase MutT (NUDIX family)
VVEGWGEAEGAWPLYCSAVRPPRVSSTRVVYENRWMRLREDEVERADGSPGMYAYVQKARSAIVVAIEDGHVWLTEQYRHATGGRWWELPQGAWEDDGDAEALARRELREETGLRPGTLRHLGSILYAPGFTDQEGDVWLATDLEPGPQALEDTEADLRFARVPIAEMEAMIADGRIRDAATIAGWHLARAELTADGGLPGEDPRDPDRAW